MHTFESNRRRHLARYRREILAIDEAGTFTHRGIELQYEHILPKKLIEQNILAGIRSAFWTYFAKQKISLHKYFHHLNSSQALCFNLFFPIIGNDTASLRLLEYLGVACEPTEKAEFEAVPDPGEGTSIDFMMTLRSGARVLFEVKYTEADLGKAKDDERHRAKFASVYQPRFDSRFTEASTQSGHFFQHYQIMRNILHLRLEHGDHLVFLVPRANASLARFLPDIKACLSAAAAKHVHVLYLEDAVAVLSREADHAFLQTLSEFRDKYL